MAAAGLPQVPTALVDLAAVTDAAGSVLSAAAQINHHADGGWVISEATHPPFAVTIVIKYAVLPVSIGCAIAAVEEESRPETSTR